MKVTIVTELRRRFTDECEAATVQRVLSGSTTARPVGRELDPSETAVRHWEGQGQGDGGEGPVGTLTTTEKEESAQLRNEELGDEWWWAALEGCWSVLRWTLVAMLIVVLLLPKSEQQMSAVLVLMVLLEALAQVWERTKA
jgi:transposase-like protein